MEFDRALGLKLGALGIRVARLFWGGVYGEVSRLCVKQFKA